eukprot:11603419-Heterocapsa_arctica.AAC.1
MPADVEADNVATHGRLRFIWVDHLGRQHDHLEDLVLFALVEQLEGVAPETVHLDDAVANLDNL